MVADAVETWTDVRIPGDANTDGVFNSSELVHVFQRGHFEDAIAQNSRCADGDWNADREFDTRDLIVAFQFGAFERVDQLSGDVNGDGQVNAADIDRLHQAIAGEEEDAVFDLDQDG